ncbi:MAG: hypothetical protein WBV94_06925 [Blastocatellia bacterium]
MTKSDRKAELKQYRAAIAAAWLPVVGRDRLTSYEFDLVAGWFTDGLEAALILRAIRQVAGRGTTVYSLGVIRADLVSLQREQARAHVGAHKKEPDWKTRWRADLEILIEGETNERRAAHYQQLLEDLPTLAYDQAKARYREATQAL